MQPSRGRWPFCVLHVLLFFFSCVYFGHSSTSLQVFVVLLFFLAPVLSFCYAIRFIYPLPSHERKGKSTKQGARFDGKLIRNHVMCLKLSLFFCLTALLFSELRSHLMAHQSLVHLDRYAAAVAASSDVLFQLERERRASLGDMAAKVIFLSFIHPSIHQQ